MPPTFVYVAFLLLVALPVAVGIRQLPDRLRDLRAGIRGVIYVPLLWLLLFPTAILAVTVAQYVPPLQWGWLGMNVIVVPIAEGSAGGGGGGGSGGVPLAYLAVGVPLAALAFLLFNYYEETWIYRESYPRVLGWAALHLIMGIPVWTIVPLFAVGCGFKAIYDRRGPDEAYAAHVGSNMGILALLVVSVVVVGV